MVVLGSIGVKSIRMASHYSLANHHFQRHIPVERRERLNSRSLRVSRQVPRRRRCQCIRRPSPEPRRSSRLCSSSARSIRCRQTRSRRFAKVSDYPIPMYLHTDNHQARSQRSAKLRHPPVLEDRTARRVKCQRAEAGQSQASRGRR